MTTTYFLHGLESSGNGTKGQYFNNHFPAVRRPDFSGSLDKRLAQLERLCAGQTNLRLVGSSFGGLMAVCFALRFPDRVDELILLAPALNFAGFIPPEEKLQQPTLLVIGEEDDVTPIDPVLGLAQQTFADLTVRLVADDHMLHHTFMAMDWTELLML